MLEPHRRNAIASVFLEWAVNPYSATNAHAFLFGTTPREVTYDVTKDVLGEAVADKWKAVQEAIASYWDTVKETATSDVTTKSDTDNDKLTHWKHMDTAPKDGTVIIALVMLHHYSFSENKYVETGYSASGIYWQKGEWLFWLGDERIASTEKPDPRGWTHFNTNEEVNASLYP